MEVGGVGNGVQGLGIRTTDQDPEFHKVYVWGFGVRQPRLGLPNPALNPKP